MSLSPPSPAELRDLNFEAMKQSLDGWRARVYEAWQAHGPCTTRFLAVVTKVDLLNVRPRTTELFKLGLLRCTGNAPGDDERGHRISEGIYRVATQTEWEQWRRERSTEPSPDAGQLEML